MQVEITESRSLEMLKRSFPSEDTTVRNGAYCRKSSITNSLDSFVSVNHFYLLTCKSHTITVCMSTIEYEKAFIEEEDRSKIPVTCLSTCCLFKILQYLLS